MSLEDRIITAENLSKSYLIWSSPLARLRSPAYRWLADLPILPLGWKKLLRRKARECCREFFALHDVSFHVERGHSVGIIGRNGSGKSTLLQIITGTLQPTGGQAEIRGRVAALLELGSGFNPEFTGRENIRLNASLHGLLPAEIEARMDDIVAFADIGDFIDQPAKTYSSGMMLRVAFAVIAHIDADVLIIDEALAVGDTAFTRKCFSRIERFQAGGGTLLLVTHDATSIMSFCDQALLLEHGERLLFGSPKLVTSQYLKLAFAAPDQYETVKAEVIAATDSPEPAAVAVVGADGGSNGALLPRALPRKQSKAQFLPTLVSQSAVQYLSRGALIQQPSVVDEDGREVNALVRGERYYYTYRVDFAQTCQGVRFGMLIKTLNGTELGGAISAVRTEQAVPQVEAGESLDVRFAFDCRLVPGFYFLNAGVEGLLDGHLQYLHRVLDACMFKVIEEADVLATGYVDFEAEVQIGRAASVPVVAATV